MHNSNPSRSVPNMANQESIKTLKRLGYDVGKAGQDRVDVLLSLIAQIAMRMDELSVAIGDDIRSKMPSSAEKHLTEAMKSVLGAIPVPTISPPDCVGLRSTELIGKMRPGASQWWKE